MLLFLLVSLSLSLEASLGEGAEGWGWGEGQGDWVGLEVVTQEPQTQARKPRVLASAGIQDAASLVSRSSGLTLYLPPSALGQTQSQSFPPPQVSDHPSAGRDGKSNRRGGLAN